MDKKIMMFKDKAFELIGDSKNINSWLKGINNEELDNWNRIANPIINKTEEDINKEEKEKVITLSLVLYCREMELDALYYEPELFSSLLGHTKKYLLTEWLVRQDKAEMLGEYSLKDKNSFLIKGGKNLNKETDDKIVRAILKD